MSNGKDAQDRAAQFNADGRIAELESAMTCSDEIIGEQVDRIAELETMLYEATKHKTTPSRWRKSARKMLGGGKPRNVACMEHKIAELEAEIARLRDSIPDIAVAAMAPPEGLMESIPDAQAILDREKRAVPCPHCKTPMILDYDSRYCPNPGCGKGPSDLKVIFGAGEAWLYEATDGLIVVTGPLKSENIQYHQIHVLITWRRLRAALKRKEKS
jgi:hypothetical protein